MTLESSDVFGGSSKLLEKLIAALEEAFPHHIPNPSDDLALIMYRAGQRSKLSNISTLSVIKSRV